MRDFPVVRKPSLGWGNFAECSAGLLFELRHLLALKVFLRVLDRLDRREPAEFGRFPRCLEGELPEAQTLKEEPHEKKRSIAPADLFLASSTSFLASTTLQISWLARVAVSPVVPKKSKFLTEMF